MMLQVAAQALVGVQNEALDARKHQNEQVHRMNQRSEYEIQKEQTSAHWLHSTKVPARLEAPYMSF